MSSLVPEYKRHDNVRIGQTWQGSAEWSEHKFKRTDLVGDKTKAREIKVTTDTSVKTDLRENDF